MERIYVFPATEYEPETPVKLEWSFYSKNLKLSLRLIAESPYCKGDWSEPFITATVNLPESSVLPEDVQFVKEKDFWNIGGWLEDNGIAEPTPLVVTSGHESFRAYRFRVPEDVLNRIKGLETRF